MTYRQLASSLFMASEASRERMHKWVATPHGAEDRRTCNNLLQIFTSASLRQSKIRLAEKWGTINWFWLMSFLAKIITASSFPGFPPTRPTGRREPWERGCHYRTFRNMMLMEIGNIMIAAFSGKEQDRSFPLWLVNADFLRTVQLNISPCCLDFNSMEYIKQQIRRPRRGCQESITIPNLIVFVVFKRFPPTKSADFKSKCICLR